MIDLDEARKVAQRYVDAQAIGAEIDLMLLDDQTIEKPYGWIFFYDSRRHVETGDISEALAGNAPIVVFNDDGRVHETGTALPLEHYLKEFER